MRILFTAIGGSDPIKKQLDGPMLHCVRVYKPDIVYMYLSKKMLEYENRDQRYSWMIQQVADKLGKRIDIVKIARDELSDVHLFDSFYEDFEGILGDIIADNPEAELFLNASSGTPAMKSALVIIAAMSHKPINVIQVSSGETVPVHDRDSDEEYDRELQWELDLDNEPDFVDRTSLVKNDSFIVKLEKNNIEKYVLEYDYSSALDTAKKIKDSISRTTFSLINAAYRRFMLDHDGVDNNIKGKKLSIIPQRDQYKRKVVEYILWLDAVRKKKDYLSFIRGITPIAYELMLQAVKPLLGVSLNTVFERRKNGYRITRSKLMESETGQRILKKLDSDRDNPYSDTFCGTRQLNMIIDEFSDNEEIKKRAASIRMVEEEVRNEVAHTLVYIDEKTIIQKVKMTPEQISETIKSFADILGFSDKGMWNSYEKMNEMILKHLYGSFRN